MRRKRILFLGVLLIWLFSVPALAASAFPDVDAVAEYVDAVDFVSSTGIMVGDNLGNFNPNKTVTRAEMATIICRVRSQTEDLTTALQFSDVPLSHWANAYVNKAVELGIVNGYGNNRFGPSDDVLYEQAITMLIRAAGMEDAANQAGGYPQGFLSVAKENGMLEGIQGKLGEPLSRADIAVLIYNGDNLLITLE